MFLEFVNAKFRSKREKFSYCNLICTKIFGTHDVVNGVLPLTWCSRFSTDMQPRTLIQRIRSHSVIRVWLVVLILCIQYIGPSIGQKYF